MSAEAPDLLAGAAWEYAGADPGADEPSTGWRPAVVPGTVGAARMWNGESLDAPIDDRDWWFRTRLTLEADTRAELVCEGLAGIAEVRLDGEPVLWSDDMFVASRVAVELHSGANELRIRVASLERELAGRRARPRWRVRRLTLPNLRWARQTLLGRLRGAPPTPPPVGPWRPVRLIPVSAPRIVSRRIRAAPDASGGGSVAVRVVLRGDVDAADAALEAGGTSASALLRRDGDDLIVEGTVALPAVERWWPRGAGPQPLYPVVLRIGDRTWELGRVGFRDVAVDASDGGFRFVVNGVPLFVGGAVWMPADPVGLRADRETLAPLVETLAAAHLMMLRVPGDTIYESDAFYDLCDELGLLVWQDCALAFSDPPADDEWERALLAGVRENLERISAHPSLALVSGGSEIAQQAVYAGASLDGGLPLLTDRLPAVVAEAAGAVPYLPTSPWGGDVPTRPDTGVSHYYGVGAYLREPADARRARPRFAAETLAFAVPPAREAVDRAFGGAEAAGHTPDWKRAVFRDAGASWDFEDVRDHYVATLFGIDPLEVRRTDPERHLEFGRAAVAALMESTFAEWRRSGSGSGGGLVFYSHDPLPGAGLGLLDADGAPKSSWSALRRVLAPVTVTISDEGLNGLAAHIYNAGPDPLAAALEVELLVRGEIVADRATVDLPVPARASVELGVDALFDGFRDLAWAHRFGPLTYDVIVVTLRDPRGTPLAEAVHLPGGLSRPVEPDLGLTASATRTGDAAAELVLRSRRYAQFVSVDAAGWRPEESGFSLPPGRDRRIRLVRVRDGAALRGTVHVLNGEPVPFSAPTPSQEASR